MCADLEWGVIYGVHFAWIYGHHYTQAGMQDEKLVVRVTTTPRSYGHKTGDLETWEEQLRNW